jgi:DNA-binding CsgD family transcriptional regulator
MFFLFQKLLNLLKQKREKVSITFHSNFELLSIIRETAQKQGTTEEEVWISFARDGSYQYLQNLKLEACWDNLSEREQEIAALACLKNRNSEIANILGISPETVKTHLRNIYNKFSIRSRRELQLILTNWRFKEYWESRRKIHGS